MTWTLEDEAALRGEVLRTVSPVLAAYVRTLDDAIPEEPRQRLKPYLPRLINTAGDAALDRRRAYLAADTAVRVFAPMALDAAGLRDEAETLRSLAPVTDTETAQRAAEAVAAEWAAAAARVAWLVARVVADPAPVWDAALDLLDRMIAA